MRKRLLGNLFGGSATEKAPSPGEVELEEVRTGQLEVPHREREPEREHKYNDIPQKEDEMFALWDECHEVA